MTYQVVIEIRAETEFSEAVAYYDWQEPGLGQRFARDVARMFQIVSQDPTRFPRAGRRSHKAKIAKWPYSIYYAIRENPPAVVIHDVYHGARDPAELRSRLK